MRYSLARVGFSSRETTAQFEAVCVGPALAGPPPLRDRYTIIHMEAQVYWDLNLDDHTDEKDVFGPIHDMVGSLRLGATFDVLDGELVCANLTGDDGIGVTCGKLIITKLDGYGLHWETVRQAIRDHARFVEIVMEFGAVKPAPKLSPNEERIRQQDRVTGEAIARSYTTAKGSTIVGHPAISEAVNPRSDLWVLTPEVEEAYTGAPPRIVRPGRPSIPSPSEERVPGYLYGVVVAAGIKVVKVDWDDASTRWYKEDRGCNPPKNWSVGDWDPAIGDEVYAWPDDQFVMKFTGPPPESDPEEDEPAGDPWFMVPEIHDQVEFVDARGEVTHCWPVAHRFKYDCRSNEGVELAAGRDITLSVIVLGTYNSDQMIVLRHVEDLPSNTRWYCPPMQGPVLSSMTDGGIVNINTRRPGPGVSSIWQVWAVRREAPPSAIRADLVSALKFFSDDELRVYLAGSQAENFSQDITMKQAMQLLLDGMTGYREATRESMLEEIEGEEEWTSVPMDRVVARISDVVTEFKTWLPGYTNAHPDDGSDANDK